MNGRVRSRLFASINRDAHVLMCHLDRSDWCLLDECQGWMDMHLEALYCRRRGAHHTSPLGERCSSCSMYIRGYINGRDHVKISKVRYCGSWRVGLLDVCNVGQEIMLLGSHSGHGGMSGL